MTLIIQHAEFHVRAMKSPNLKNNTRGYNFSYPVMNTIDICGLFVSGESIDIHIERMGKSIWSFDKETSILTIERNGRSESHHIDDVEELSDAMLEYFYGNVQRLSEKHTLTSAKKSVAKLGNQNARKGRNNAKNNGQEDRPAERVGISDKHGHAAIENEKVDIDKMDCEEPSEFCDLMQYFRATKGKSDADYFAWIIKNNWKDRLDADSKMHAVRMGYPGFAIS
ncbi:MAG: hypothetical protein FWF97_04090 [Alphaproteobacteria bacterium]|nr:hypothetical protein [Alphaproteobacteria bacterium]